MLSHAGSGARPIASPRSVYSLAGLVLGLDLGLQRRERLRVQLEVPAVDADDVAHLAVDADPREVMCRRALGMSCASSHSGSVSGAAMPTWLNARSGSK